MNRILLPTWEQARVALKAGTASPLDRFVYDNEPAGEADEKAFREQLQELVDYLLPTVEITTGNTSEYIPGKWR